MKRVTLTTPDGTREVVRFIIDLTGIAKPERVPQPTIQLVDLSPSSRKLIVEALGLVDGGSLIVGELADDFEGMPKGSAAASYSGGEGVVTHVIGAPLTLVNLFDEKPNGIALGTGDQRDAEIRMLSEQLASRDEELTALRARVAELTAPSEEAEARASLKVVPPIDA